jgi:TolB protein
VGVIQEEAGQMRIEVRLFEIPSRQTILAKAYKVKKELARKAAHVIADDLLKHLKNLNFANSKIIFSKETLVQADQDRYLAKDLYIMDYDGYNPLPITRRSMAISPHAIRHEGQIWLAYCRYKNANTFVASYGMVFQTGLQQPPVPLIESDVTRTSTPSLSPGGDKIAFSMVEEGNVDIYVMNLDGSNLLRLTRHPGVDTNPSWAPGGRSLLFTSDRTGAPQIYRMDADGVNRERITFDNPYNDGAVWNPRYDYIAYLSRFDSEFDIFVMDLKTRQSYRLTYRQGSNEDPCWSPDGERLCFSSNRSGSWQLYIVNRTDKDSVIQITHEGNNKTPVWVE